MGKSRVRIACVYIHIPRIAAKSEDIREQRRAGILADALRGLQKKAGSKWIVVGMEAPYKADFHFRVETSGSKRRLVRVKCIADMECI